ncbi:cobalt chelatase subunit CobN [Hyphomicrobium denitrificans 1NES1]|uniref:Cobalt chelatase subunit CobN n=1 Tax=Hyphomicrobium denitrificans 1NES1 TaxID=670307 RepID=N0B7V9_9HYPH|nr:cobaltochelatase subunit CobN [Hyphomicrobium denitrificans]AGK59098.1 cobalt chelatase subunit CobN [Hyphomicrobium denitrificans 1NES1]
MHIVVREARELDEAAAVQDLGLSPADILVLSFSDSDLAMAAAAFRDVPKAERPSLRVASLSALRHPMSVDLFIDATVKGSKAVLVRLLGGLDYWRYGGEQLSRRCRELGVALAIVPGDGRPDLRLAALSTLPSDDLAHLEALLDEGGIENTRAGLTALLARASGDTDAMPGVRAIPAYGIYRENLEKARGSAVIVFYRSHLLAGDVAPLDALADALEQRGLPATAIFLPSLKTPAAADWLRSELKKIAPAVIVNATAFAARDGEQTSPLDVADCPVLQVALTNAPQTLWERSQRGVSASDMAMHVVLPELDGRLFAGVVSFKESDDTTNDLGVSLLRHMPYDHGIAHVADLAAAWTRLRTMPRTERRVGLLLSTYPGRPDQIAHAVGLDGFESALRIVDRLKREGYGVADAPETARDVTDMLTAPETISWSLDAYKSAFRKLPQGFQDLVMSAWGAPEEDAFCVGGAFPFRAAHFENLIVGLQPERGQPQDRKAEYHDPNTPPRHSYVAFYLWLRHVAKIDALIHLGAHGTLEWLPGKAVAGSETCAPRAILGSLPLVYPFIVNDPGEAAQAKRRIAAVTLGHLPPPMTDAGISGPLSEVERLVDEFSSADGLDPRRRKSLSEQIVDAATRAGIAERCGLTTGMPAADALVCIDAFLCDVKELSIRDGLHVLNDAELDAIVRALDGKFIEPGPAGAPSRGRSDVLPTGRNLFSVDPRAIPTPTAWANGKRAAKAILERYVSDHGEWPRAIVLDLWGSATLRTGGEELATALALLGVRPAWDERSYRVTGVETEAVAELGRPRVDVTLRISGLFRDMFGAQLALFDTAVALVAQLREDASDNPLVECAKTEMHLDRIFGPADRSFGSGVMQLIDRGVWANQAELGASYIESSAHAYNADGTSAAAGNDFESRVKNADAFVHIQDHREIDLLTGGDFAAHEGGFAAAAASVGNGKVSLYHGDTGVPEAPRVRTLAEECARVVHGRAANPRWIDGQMRHGFRGAAEMAQSVDAAFAFAATAKVIDDGGFERLYQAYLGDPAVAAFIARENPAAIDAMRRRFDEAIARGLWHPRRNDIAMRPEGHAKPDHPSSREAAE